MFRNTPASISHSSRDSPKPIRAPNARASRLAMCGISPLPLRESQVCLRRSAGRVLTAEAGHPVLRLVGEADVDGVVQVQPFAIPGRDDRVGGDIRVVAGPD